MKILSMPIISEADQCPYLKEERFRQEYFAGIDLDSRQFQSLLDQRWRRFGTVFFRPVCPGCRKCLPIRVVADSFSPSKSQRRILRKNRDTEVVFRSLEFREEFYYIYEKHSLEKFGQKTSREEFRRNFYNPGVPSFQSEYYINGKPAGFGILDQSWNGLSSVYFCYDPRYSEYGLGTFSVLREIQATLETGLQYYYLGYYIQDSPKMSYKGRFRPHEFLKKGSWIPSYPSSENSV